MPIFRYLFFIFLTHYTMLPGFAQARTVLVFGDSLSAGYGLERGQEWPALLQQRLNNQGMTINIINHSLTGETTRGGLDRLSNSLNDTTPDILILELGANDGLRALPLEHMHNNLQSMINMAHARKIKVLLAGMHIPTNYGEAYSTLFHQKFQKLAQDNQLDFLPFLLDKLPLGLTFFQEDGLHPNAAAQTQIMENIWQVLEPMLSH